VISQGLPSYVALEPVDMRMGYERLGGLVRECMHAEPRSKALFVFVGKRHTMKVLTWDGTGAIIVHKKLEAVATTRSSESSRYVDEAGGSLGASIVHAMWQDAIHNAAVISRSGAPAVRRFQRLPSV
jgi:transposase